VNGVDEARPVSPELKACKLREVIDQAV